MSKVKDGDKVNVHYHGTLHDGTTFDSSEGREPLEFVVGEGRVIKGFDSAVLGMEVGEKKRVEIPVDEAYGQPDERNLIEFPKDQFPAEIEIQVGASLHLNDNAGNVFPVVIKEVNGDTVILDGNHPLAGKDLIFDLELVSIN